MYQHSLPMHAAMTQRSLLRAWSKQRRQPSTASTCTLPRSSSLRLRCHAPCTQPTCACRQRPIQMCRAWRTLLRESGCTFPQMWALPGGLRFLKLCVTSWLRSAWNLLKWHCWRRSELAALWRHWTMDHISEERWWYREHPEADAKAVSLEPEGMASCCLYVHAAALHG